MENAELLKAIETTGNKLLDKLETIHTEIREIRKQVNMIDGERLLDVPQTCEMLGICDRQLRRIVSSSELSGILFGRRRLFPLSEVQLYMKKIAAQGISTGIGIPVENNHL